MLPLAGAECQTETPLIFRQEFTWRRNSPGERQTLERDRGLAAGDQVGGDPRPAVAHGPAHMALTGVEPQIALLALAQDRRSLRRHRPKSRPVFGLRIVGAVRKQPLDDLQHVTEIVRSVARVVARELRR